MKLYNKLAIAGGVLVVVFNPLAVAIWSDGLVELINLIAKQLVNISNYTVVIGVTLLAVAGILYWDGRSKKQTAKLKKLKHKKTEKAGDYLL
jgi:hypothetical protein